MDTKRHLFVFLFREILDWLLDKVHAYERKILYFFVINEQLLRFEFAPKRTYPTSMNDYAKPNQGYTEKLEILAEVLQKFRQFQIFYVLLLCIFISWWSGSGP